MCFSGLARSVSSTFLRSYWSSFFVRIYANPRFFQLFLSSIIPCILFEIDISSAPPALLWTCSHKVTQKCFLWFVMLIILLSSSFAWLGIPLSVIIHFSSLFFVCMFLRFNFSSDSQIYTSKIHGSVRSFAHIVFCWLWFLSVSMFDFTCVSQLLTSLRHLVRFSLYFSWAHFSCDSMI